MYSLCIIFWTVRSDGNASGIFLCMKSYAIEPALIKSNVQNFFKIREWRFWQSVFPMFHSALFSINCLNIGVILSVAHIGGT